jgi:hypothetical protein
MNSASQSNLLKQFPCGVLPVVGNSTNPAELKEQTK